MTGAAGAESAGAASHEVVVEGGGGDSEEETLGETALEVLRALVQAVVVVLHVKDLQASASVFAPAPKCLLGESVERRATGRDSERQGCVVAGRWRHRDTVAQALVELSL